MTTNTVASQITPGCLVKLGGRKSPMLVVGEYDGIWTIQGAHRDFYLTFEPDGRALLVSSRAMSFPVEVAIESVIL